MTLVALDVNASRLRAALGPAQDARPVALEGKEDELPLALSLEGRYPEVGRASCAGPSAARRRLAFTSRATSVMRTSPGSPLAAAQGAKPQAAALPQGWACSGSTSYSRATRCSRQYCWQSVTSPSSSRCTECRRNISGRLNDRATRVASKAA